MATAYKVHIVPEDTGLLKVKQTAEAAKKAEELLQEDLEKHHVFFNEEGFHNHIPHHILALYGTGAPPSSLQRGYDGNTSYQRPAQPTHEAVVEDLISTWEHAQRYLGKEKYYPDFLRFFQREITTNGVQPTLLRYVFSGEPETQPVFTRLFSGLVHPLIQLMYGLEWNQPAIIASALAQTAVHGNPMESFFVESETLSHSRSSSSPSEKMPHIVDLLQEIRSNRKLATAARMSDANKIRDGVLTRARDEMLSIAGRVRVSPENLDEKTAEMFEACLLVAAGAAVHPTKHPKFDFFLIHHVNVSPIFPTLNAHPWIPTQTKARLLEYKIRLDLADYAARGAPDFSPSKIASYTPRDENNRDQKPLDIIARLHDFDDDGHAIKLGRAALICHDLVSTKYPDAGWRRIEGEDVWTRLFHLIVDSVEGPGPNWVRTCGLEEAWKDVPDAQDSKL
ncbi:HypA protein [Echria macrotheca]|uniref:HypA protein n=1 Tax=Echria macrotheca TaxID=438768 RepID=A0AAJ0BN04_9PEZI|nr:HypA protein [Echria macrotheca]